MRSFIDPARRRRLAAAGLAVIAVVVADHRGWLLARSGNDLSDYDGVRARVVRVLDGVTLEIDRPDPLHRTPRTRLRLWGVASPATPAGRDRAVAVARRWLAGGSVILRLEPDATRGTFGALLVHLERPDGSTLNETLLETGAAAVEDGRAHRRLSAYARAEARARRAGRGRWTPRPRIRRRPRSSARCEVRGRLLRSGRTRAEEG